MHKDLSEIYAAANQPKEALIAINEAIKLSPDNVDYLLAKAKITNWNKQPTVALESYQKILQLGKSEKIKVNTKEILIEIGRLQTQLKITRML